MRICFTSGERFYRYENGVWKIFKEKDLHRTLYQLIENVQENVWKPTHESSYLAHLIRGSEYVGEFDLNKGYINLSNGMFNTETFVLEPHSPDFFSSIQNPMEYDPDAKCPRFIKFLDEVFQGDESTINVVQEMMGYCLSAETKAHKMFILVGVGSNGKSVFIEVMENLCGLGNVSHVPLNELNHPFARAELVGKILNVSTENEFNEKGMNTQQIKSITAGDTIRVENKHEKGFSYKAICKLLFALNNLPTSLDRSFGFYRRLVIIPFRRIFRGQEADKNLTAKLLEELPGIFNFAMEGLKRLKQQDYQFSDSKVISDAVQGYKAQQNPIIPFVMEHIEIGAESDRLGTNELFDVFALWCKRNGESDFLASVVKNNRRGFWNSFTTALLEAGLPPIEQKKSNNWRYLPGLVLLKDPKPDLNTLFEDEEDDDDTPDYLFAELMEEIENETIHKEIGYILSRAQGSVMTWVDWETHWADNPQKFAFERTDRVNLTEILVH